METRIKFRHFEIRRPTYIGAPPAGHENDWDVVKWSEDCSHCWSIAFLRWDPTEDSYDLESVGMRLLTEIENGLAEFIIKFVELQEMILNYDD